MSKRALVVLVVAAGAAISVLRLGSGAAAPSAPTVTASRNDVVVSVGGVGRIVEARGPTEVAIPSSAGSAPGATGATNAATSAPADAVFSLTPGHVSRFLVKPGQRVARGQALALLDDGGASAAAVRQARNDLATAELELREKSTSDPTRGTPATSEEVTAAEDAVIAARRRLKQLLGPPRPADVSAARLDEARAVADLETLEGGRPAARASAIRLAKENVRLGRVKLDRLLAPPSKADVRAADADVAKAVAELAALRRPAQPPLAAATKALRGAVEAAKQKLVKLTTGAPDPVTVSAAQADLAKAQSDLVVLQRGPTGPLPEAVAAADQAVTTAQQTLADAEAARPRDPAAISAAQLDVAKAIADQAALLQPARAPLPEEFAALAAAVDAANVRLNKATGPPDPADVSAAQLEIDKAVAELATLERPAPPPLPRAVSAARKAVAAARLKRSTLGKPNPADVKAARVDLERAQADLRTLEDGPTPDALAAAHQAVRAARVKLKQLLGPAPRADVTAAQLEIRKAQADLAVLRARGGPAPSIEIELARLKVESARSRLADARRTTRLLTVRAPNAGTVTGLTTVVGAPVDGTTPVATVADLDHLAVAVGLSEFDAAPVRKGMPAVVSVDALGGKKFPGKVAFAALTGVDSGGVVTFPVVVSLTRIAGLKPGMNVSVRIVVAQRRNVVEVPLEAVTREGDEESTVTVLTPAGDELQRKVTLGLANNKVVEIVKGLRAGQRVVIAEGGDEGD